MANYWLEMRFYNAMLLQDIEKKQTKDQSILKTDVILFTLMYINTYIILYSCEIKTICTINLSLEG